MIHTIKIIRIGLAALFAALVFGCTGKQEKRENEPLRVKTETVATSVSTDGRTYVGTVEEMSSTSVSFVGTGTVQRVAVREGQHVQRGQLVAQMDPTQCKNTLSSCEAQVRQAEDALERMRQLHDAGSLADMKWVETQSQVEQARAMLQMANCIQRDTASLRQHLLRYIGLQAMRCNTCTNSLQDVLPCALDHCNNPF